MDEEKMNERRSVLPDEIWEPKGLRDEEEFSLRNYALGRAPVEPNMKLRMIIIAVIVSLVAILTFLTWITGTTTPI